jgi:phosphoserine phosphatase RsbU/P
MLVSALIITLIALFFTCKVAVRWRNWALSLDEDRQRNSQERGLVLGFMHGFVEAVGAGVSREELFRRVTHSAVAGTGALSSCVFEVRGNELVAVAVEGLFPPQMPLPRGTNYQISTRARFIEGILRSQKIPMGQGLIGTVASTGEGVLLCDAQDDQRMVHIADPALALHCIIAVPIRFQKRMIAVMAVANSADGQPFTASDFSLASGIAEQAALAVHNLDLIESQRAKSKMDVDLALASSIQSMLLPKKMPENASVDFGALYLPAQKVGGDLYDVFQIDESRYGVAVADVSGKGVAASLIMAICQSNLRHLARSGISPARVLSDLNAIMREEMRRDMFVTIVYAIVDTAEDTVTLARAGHELPVMLRRLADGSFKPVFLESEGMALGMSKESIFDAVIEEKTFPFGSGEILVLYTDGITEAANRQGAQYSSERLADSIQDLREKSAQELNERLFDRVLLFADGTPQGDDVTMLTIKHR